MSDKGRHRHEPEGALSRCQLSAYLCKCKVLVAFEGAAP